MPCPEDPGIDRGTFSRIATAFERRFVVALCFASPTGRAIHSSPGRPSPDGRQWRQSRRLAIAEAVRWGDTAVCAAPDNHQVWAVPLMTNQRLLGGICATVPEHRLLTRESESPSIDARLACSELRRMVEQHNLTNAALLEMRRAEYRHERQRAEAIHDLKAAAGWSFRQTFLIDEPELVAAVRRGDRGRARLLLNNILAAILHQGGDQFDHVKSLILELIATVTRTAVEAGGDLERLLGGGFASLSRLAEINDLEQLAPWLHQVLEEVLDEIGARQTTDHEVVVSRAMDYLAQHLGEDVSRDEVARAVNVSPSHFSRLFKRHTGLSYREVLTRLRIRRAAELLARSDTPIAVIAMECGFADQSYFTKVFRGHMGCTPRSYRLDREQWR